MANNYYSYQYETSPRKLSPEYNSPKKNKAINSSKKKIQQKKKDSSKKITKTTKSSGKAKENSKNKDNLKEQKKLNGKLKFSIGCKTVLIFAALFFVLFRESQINESFSKIQSLKAEITAIQKENDQLEINIQNGINLNTIEQAAKERLGMQKLTPKQTIRITLPKKDYVEHVTEEVIIEEEQNWFESFSGKIKSFFNKN